MSKRFVAYISKYAMTYGILKIDAEDCFDISSDMIRDTEKQLVYYRTPDWHYTHELAIQQAETMRIKKLASLHKQIDRLANVTFVVPL